MAAVGLAAVAELGTAVSPACGRTASSSGTAAPAAERARSRVGPTLIAHVTYRADAHSTSDDPSRYRPKDDWAAWPLGEPIERLKQYLISQKEWSAQHHATQEEELKALVVASWQEAITY